MAEWCSNGRSAQRPYRPARSAAAREGHTVPSLLPLAFFFFFLFSLQPNANTAAPRNPQHTPSRHAIARAGHRAGHRGARPAL